MRIFFFLLFLLLTGFPPAFSEDLKLEGILCDAVNPEASFVLINGAAFRRGDQVENYRIGEITPDYVDVVDSKTGKSVKLTVLEGENRIVLPAAVPEGSAAPAGKRTAKWWERFFGGPGKGGKTQ